MARIVLSRSGLRWDDIDKRILGALVSARFSGLAIGLVLRRSAKAVFAMRRKLHINSVSYYRDRVDMARSVLYAQDIYGTKKDRVRERVG